MQQCIMIRLVILSERRKVFFENRMGMGIRAKTKYIPFEALGMK